MAQDIARLVKKFSYFGMINLDKLAKSPKYRHAPASAGAGSAKEGIQNYLKTLDSRLRGNVVKGRFKTYYETSLIGH